MNIGTDPAEALANLGKDISSTTLASGNLGALDNTMKLAISKQEELLANITNPNVRESSSKNFTASITDLSDVIMSNSDAFWGLDVDERLSNIDNVQKNIDISLSIMAINLVNNPTYQLTDETVGKKILQYGFIKKQYSSPFYVSQLFKPRAGEEPTITIPGTRYQ